MQEFFFNNFIKKENLVQVFSFELCEILKATPSSLRQFLTMESLLKMMKNAFYFTLKAFFVLKIFRFLSLLVF